jgi:hypothetical protein
MEIGYFEVMVAISLIFAGFGLFRRIDGLTMIGASMLILLGLFLLLSPLTTTTYLVSSEHLLGNSTNSTTTYTYSTNTTNAAPAQDNVGDLLAVMLTMTGVALAFGTYNERKL